MFASVCLLCAPFATYEYALPDSFPASFWRPGLRVLIPVGRTLRSGVIQELMPESQLPQEIKSRPIVFPLELDPLIDPGLLCLALDLARRQGCSPGMCLGHVLPAGLRKPALKIIRALSNQKQTLSGSQIAALPEQEYEELARAFLAGSAQIVRSAVSAAELEIYSLAIDPPWPVRPAATRQIALLDYLYANGSASRARLAQQLGPDIGETLKKMLAAGLVKFDLCENEAEDDRLLPPPDPQFELSEEQQKALNDLAALVKAGKPATRLLYGVTGSGKTAVYLELIRACLRENRSCLLLAPEVALAHKLYRDVKIALPDAQHFLYHGYQHPARREEIFRAVAGQKRPCLVVGTRSSLFLPLANPGLVILDEEHDGSYKQDDNLPYHAKELAWARMQSAGGLLLLGSATPDIRTFHAARNGAIPQLDLRKRVSGAQLPPVELVQLPLAAGVVSSGQDHGLLSPECETALLECVKRDEQAVILLNRRGYAPQIYCLSCEKTLKCPNCQIGMAFHKGIGKLVCHYCDYSLPWPAPCPECGDTNYIALGEGTEKIAERLAAIAGRPVLRLDRDIARRTERIEDILTQFGAGVSPFLVGTQMLSKGHHFPNVTLVVVADGDIGLNLPDYRAAERTFQLLIQSAGRAGRGQKPGRAMIQTRNPNHYCWQHILNYDYEGFYAAELALRERFRYPPFTRLGLLRFSFPVGDDEAMAQARDLGQELRRQARSMGIEFLGPAPAPLPIINARKRVHCLMKAKNWQPMRELWFAANRHKAAARVRMTLDLDPVNMM